jgi:hypothetical protein
MEGRMADLVQDVVSLVCMSTFIITAAVWIGAL